MIVYNTLKEVGQYCLFMTRVLTTPDRWRVFCKRTINEIFTLGIGSIPLVTIISIFVGAVTTIQMKINLVSPLLPRYTIGMSAREIILLEFSSTILCLLLAGKVGSSVASEIGTMRVTEQIDALEIMGVNSANYLVLPKLIGFVGFIPILCIYSMFNSLVGGWLIAVFTDLVSVDTYLYGIRTMFNEWYVWYSLIKCVVFATIITSVASFYGYYVKGGSVEVGKSSTKSVVNASILILLFDVILTKLLLQ